MKNFLRSCNGVFIFSISGKQYLRFENIQTLEIHLYLIVPETTALFFSFRKQAEHLGS